MEYKDYYNILGVDKKASQKDIKAAYRRLARQYHPDVNPGDKASEERFKEINEAYEVLNDTEKRQKYEQWCGNKPCNYTSSPGPIHYAASFPSIVMLPHHARALFESFRSSVPFQGRIESAAFSPSISLVVFHQITVRKVPSG